MKIFNYQLINNKGGKYAIVDIKERVREVYSKDNRRDTEAAYLAYRTITGATVQESWKVIKPWIRKWEGKV